MLNYTAGVDAMQAACAAAELKTIGIRRGSLVIVFFGGGCFLPGEPGGFVGDGSVSSPGEFAQLKTRNAAGAGDWEFHHEQ